MLDLIFSLFKTLLHSLQTILHLIISIPGYIVVITNLLIAVIPPFMYPFIIMILTVSVIIAIKRLVF